MPFRIISSKTVKPVVHPASTTCPSPTLLGFDG
jgi:hypothetical protein